MKADSVKRMVTMFGEIELRPTCWVYENRNIIKKEDIFRMDGQKMK